MLLHPRHKCIPAQNQMGGLQHLIMFNIINKLPCYCAVNGLIQYDINVTDLLTIAYIEAMFRLKVAFRSSQYKNKTLCPCQVQILPRYCRDGVFFDRLSREVFLRGVF